MLPQLELFMKQLKVMAERVNRQMVASACNSSMSNNYATRLPSPYRNDAVPKPNTLPNDTPGAIPSQTLSQVLRGNGTTEFFPYEVKEGTDSAFYSDMSWTLPQENQDYNAWPDSPQGLFSGLSTAHDGQPTMYPEEIDLDMN